MEALRDGSGDFMEFLRPRTGDVMDSLRGSGDLALSSISAQLFPFFFKEIDIWGTKEPLLGPGDEPFHPKIDFLVNRLSDHGTEEEENILHEEILEKWEQDQNNRSIDVCLVEVQAKKRSFVRSKS
eukprot:CAMPEP_0201536522 /NCGR_PEP_ID=MMETSP0161_2-20130828/62057_1 /ASSEMBLY_ACC=CAM_ASM_000251 /TAXON_ID=180227 /ORGANISM="Neoparamoeba aestuarina, Strain SoJaBio B1-5/56/2" /LENGTH=125 /DNA_ID=CAMNT_0047942269 /DNA_START=781 /DNA_END=1159 /DNA_ORIENTATION=+